jgi:hypothetical protein
MYGTTETVFSFRCCTDRKRFSVFGEFGREHRKRFSVSKRSFIPLDLDKCGGNVGLRDRPRTCAHLCRVSGLIRRSGVHVHHDGMTASRV